MTAYSQGDPRQKIQVCRECNDATGNCEEDSVFFDTPTDRKGPLCTPCYDHLQKVYPAGESNPQGPG